MKRKYKQNRIFTPNNPLSPRICPELATEIGLNESILLLQYEFWMATEGEERGEFLWLRKTVREVREVFKFWGVATIDRIIQKLLAKGYMVAGDFDEGPGKGSRWMRFDFERLSSLKSIKVDCSISEQRMSQKQARSDQIGTTVLITEKNKTKEQSVRANGNSKPRRPGSFDDRNDKSPKFGIELIRVLPEDWLDATEVAMREKFPALNFTEVHGEWCDARTRDGSIGKFNCRIPTLVQYSADIEIFFRNWNRNHQNGRNGNNGNGAERPVWMASGK
jgi:hypothetical protein